MVSYDFRSSIDANKLLMELSQQEKEGQSDLPTQLLRSSLAIESH